MTTPFFEVALDIQAAAKKAVNNKIKKNFKYCIIKNFDTKIISNLTGAQASLLASEDNLKLFIYQNDLQTRKQGCLRSDLFQLNFFYEPKIRNAERRFSRHLIK